MESALAGFPCRRTSFNAPFSVHYAVSWTFRCSSWLHRCSKMTSSCFGAPSIAQQSLHSLRRCELTEIGSWHRSARKTGRGSAIYVGNYDEIDVLEEVKQKLKDPEHDFSGTPYIPIYVMLPLGVINYKNHVSDPQQLVHDLQVLKSLRVDGVMVDVWWGLVEKGSPQKYNWAAYVSLFNKIRDAELKLQVILSFHQCGGNIGDDANIPLPKWILDIGIENPDIFFTDKHGTRNSECLSWGIDKERVLKGRTGLEVYFDFMRSFRQTFDEFFKDGTIEEIAVGLGPCGELRYPSYPRRNGWEYPGIGEFQCYDKYLKRKLEKAATNRGSSTWGMAPMNAGTYNSQPYETDFFRHGGEYDSYYGRFFLHWYSEILIDHGDNVLGLAKLVFAGTRLSAKVAGIHWWYKTTSHAAELTAGFYNSAHLDGYGPIARMFAKHDVTFNFTCLELRTTQMDEYYPEALSDPEGLVWQVLNVAWDTGIHVASENALVCYDRAGYDKILENAKPRNDPDGRHLRAFTYLRLASALLEAKNVIEFARFVDCLHGDGTNSASEYIRNNYKLGRVGT